MPESMPAPGVVMPPMPESMPPPDSAISATVTSKVTEPAFSKVRVSENLSPTLMPGWTFIIMT